MGIIELLIAMGLPSAVTGFAFWLLERKIDSHQKSMNEKERVREQSELYLIKSVQASIALGEATARAVQRIPDAHCNGDMHQALAYAQKVKHEQKDFLSEQAIRNLY